MKNYIKIISIQKVKFADWYVFATDENKHSYYVPRYKCLGTTILPNLQPYYIPEYDRLCRISNLPYAHHGILDPPNPVLFYFSIISNSKIWMCYPNCSFCFPTARM